MTHGLLRNASLAVRNALYSPEQSSYGDNQLNHYFNHFQNRLFSFTGSNYVLNGSKKNLRPKK